MSRRMAPPAAPPVDASADDPTAPRPKRKTPYAKGERPEAALAKSVSRYSPAESREQERLVEALLTQGYGERTIFARVRRMAEKGEVATAPGLSRTIKLAARVRERWQREDSDKRAEWKSSQIRRLRNAMTMALSGQKDAQGAWLHRPNLAVYARLESLLADVQGTREPLQVSVDVRYTEAMMMVIGSMDATHLTEVLAEAQEAEELAARYRREHPELTAGGGIEAAE